MARFAVVGEPWKFEFCETEAQADKVVMMHRAKKGWVAEWWEL